MKGRNRVSKRGREGGSEMNRAERRKEEERMREDGEREGRIEGRRGLARKKGREALKLNKAE